MHKYGPVIDQDVVIGDSDRNYDVDFCFFMHGDRNVDW